MTGLKIDANKKTKFLPQNLKETFGHLEVYSAANCSIQKISKNNFAELTKLKRIWLDNNKIDKIPADSFEDLYSLYFTWVNTFWKNFLVKNLRIKIFKD